MSAIMHVMEQGHKCVQPFQYRIRAEDIKAGELRQIGDWELSYNPRQRMYVVHRAVYPYGQFDYYEFTNINCAAAKLAELGGYKNAEQN